MLRLASRGRVCGGSCRGRLRKKNTEGELRRELRIMLLLKKHGSGRVRGVDELRILYLQENGGSCRLRGINEIRISRVRGNGGSWSGIG
jgi:hypothetical protein